MIGSETGYGGEYNGEENRDNYGRIYWCFGKDKRANYASAVSGNDKCKCWTQYFVLEHRKCTSPIQSMG